MSPLGNANETIRNTAMILRTEIARPDEPRDWFTIDDVVDRLPRDVDEAVVAETLDLMAERGLLMSYGGKTTVKRFFAPETLQDLGTPTDDERSRSNRVERGRRSR